MLDGTPTAEPREIVAGAQLEWTKELDDYPASEWTLTYYCRGTGTGFDAIAVADGDTHVLTVPAADTAAMTPGVYYWQAWVEKGGEKFVVASGQVTVKKGFASVATGVAVDERSQAKKILDAIDAMMLGKATLDQQEYQINNRALKRIAPERLLELRKYYAGLYATERRRARVRAGRTLFQTVNVRFDKA
ncbi:MAG TPA: hypothetical protein VGV59_10030 [Pyrinomonadaceae bacterium]|nr:hypothetical protein [Pyrinomonadaceae bacterium]